METSLIDTHRKIKAELDRRKQIARELARLELREVYGRKVEDAKAAVSSLKEELRELEARVRQAPGAVRPPALGRRLAAAISGQRSADERANSSMRELEDSMLGACRSLMIRKHDVSGAAGQSAIYVLRSMPRPCHVLMAQLAYL